MARKIIWSFEATADLEAIADYIARDSSFYAAAFVLEVREASRSLNEFSERGRIVPELSNSSIRELFKNGGTYNYYDVPLPVYVQMNTAASKGQFLAQNIKNTYRYARV